MLSYSGMVKWIKRLLSLLAWMIRLLIAVWAVNALVPAPPRAALEVPDRVVETLDDLHRLLSMMPGDQPLLLEVIRGEELVNVLAPAR